MQLFRNPLNTLYGWYGKRTAQIVLVAIVVLLVFVLLLRTGSEDVAQVEAPREKPVRTALISELVSGDTLSTIGTVEAINESRIETEASGRVTNVYVELGDEVRAGTIIAELENAAERAAVLQAEGSYEAALAAAAASDVSVESAGAALQSANNSAKNAYRSTFTTADDIIRNLVDDFFSDIDKPPFGFKVDAEGQAPALINERVAVEAILDAWASEVNELPAEVDTTTSKALLSEALTNTRTIAALVERVAGFVSKAEPNGVFPETALTTYDSRFLAARSSLNAALDSINNNLLSVKNAEDALRKAELGGTNPELSSANAAVKQALGSLRSAQANLAKTIIRTPISGSVNELPVRTGDFLGVREHVATVANNGALLITTYVSEMDRARIAVGDAVTIEGGATGTIARIAPAVDAATKKIEVKIETTSNTLSNGDTVRLTLKQNGNAVTADTDIRIPISALKVETDRTVIFTLGNENILEAHEVVTGPLVGEDIIIDEGAQLEMNIVLDARGLNEGDTVTVVN